MHRFFFLLGKPASGKGTQIRRILDTFKGSSFSTGDALKYHIARRTELGQQVKAFIDAGKLVSDDIVMALFRDSAEHLGDTTIGESTLFLVDGFPRTVGQYEMVKRYLVEKKIPHSFLYFSVADDHILRRFTGRLTCNTCFTPFSTIGGTVAENDACPQCKKGKLIRRSDDNETVVRNRLAEYRAATAPMVEHITAHEKGNFTEIESSRSEDEIFNDVRMLLTNAKISLKKR
ncbi:MAG TPA: nucleoside monophosphate kinase [bacterium]|nr:nucleoside monophosphate kinase [bacterium]